MEEEVRQILRNALLEDKQLPDNLAESIQKRFARLGEVKFTSCRETMREPPKFE